MSHDALEDPFVVPTSALAVRIDRPGEFRLVEQAVPAPDDGEVLIQVDSTGIGADDLKLIDGLHSDRVACYPLIPGHEWAGRIVALGKGVSGLRPGQPVVAEALLWCGTCVRCGEGATNLCLDGYRETGFTEPGAFSQYLIVPARLVHPLPEDVALAPAALLETVARAVSALRRTDDRPGQRMLVLGGDTFGLIAVQLLARRKPIQILLADDQPGRRALAARIGATTTLSMAQLVEYSHSVDLVVDAHGSDASMAVAAAGRGGTIVLGNAAEHAGPLDPTEVTMRGLHLHGACRARSDAWAEAIRVYAAGELDLDSLVSHWFPLTDFDTALATARISQAATGKVLVLPHSR